MSGKSLFWAIIITLVVFIIVPFPINFVLCFVLGGLLPWVTGDKNTNENSKDKDN